ncbi:MAG TPA: M23 family metallopeptidase, partial [Burkholderiaceae bacterium]
LLWFAPWTRKGWIGERLAGPIAVSVQPQQVWIEATGDGQQALNFDFVIENQGPMSMGIDRIEVLAYDSEGQLVARRHIDGGGFSPAMLTIPGREIAPHARAVVFNPFHLWRGDAPLHKLVYRFETSIVGESPEASATLTVEPRPFEGKTALSLPLRGPLLVDDGHDFLAHHRRLDTEHPMARHFGLRRNFMRYSLDLNSTDAAGALFKGKGDQNSDWPAWEQPVLAPADGVVADAGDGEPDNQRGQPSLFNPEVLIKTPMKFYGNYVVVDHGNGEFSLMGHLRQGSVKVKRGDKVSRSQQLAQVGSSGSSNNPHLHYELRTGATLDVEGLPAQFNDFTRRLGVRRVEVQRGSIDSGDRLEAH